jgi:hypothetical protein
MMARALDLYRQFHDKEPHRLTELPKDIRLPDRIGDVGHAVLIIYRSAKWSSDGRQRNYIHTFESNVRFCEPWRRGLRVVETQHWPRELVALGEFVDGVVERAGSYMRPIVLRRTKLVATSDGKRLLLYHPGAGIMAALVGGKQRVTPSGIEG